ncbi:MAG: hypothetical protein QXU11_12420 [Thermoproteota archaeon]
MYRFYEEPESAVAIGLFNYLRELAKTHPGIRIFVAEQKVSSSQPVVSVPT